MKKLTVSILTTLLMLSMVFSSSVFAAEKTTSVLDSFLGLFGVETSATTAVGVEYRGHIQNKGNFPLDGSWIQGPTELGTRGESLRMEGFWIEMTTATKPANMTIKYNVHVENEGWLYPENDSTTWPADGKFAGTVAKGQRIEAVKIVLVDAAGNLSKDYDVMYQGHVQNVGDLPANGTWYANGDKLGTTGSGLRLEALKVKIVQKVADLTAYNAALVAVSQADYTAASWTTYQTVVKANPATTNDLQSNVDTATAAITAAQANLVLVPKVASVTAINAQEVLVVTNSALSKESAENIANIDVFLNGSTTADTNISAKLQADGKSVLLRFTTPAVINQTIKVVVKDSLLTSTFDKFTAYTSDVKLFSDTTAPTVSKIEYDGTNVVATFTEPIASVTNVRVDGVTATISATQATANNVAGNYNYYIASAPITAGTHNVVLSQIKDANANQTGTQNAAYTIVENATAPKVSSLEAVTSNSFKVTFDRAIAGTTAANAVSNLVVKKGAGTIASTRVSGVLATDNKSITYTITTATSDEVQLYNTGETSATLTVSFDGYKDGSGLLGAAYTGNVTLSKDTSAPYILSKNLVTLDTAKTIVTITYNEAVDSVTAQNANIVIKKDGIIQNTTSIAKPTIGDVGSDTTERTVTLTFGSALADGAYELVLPTGMVVDKELNKSASDTISFTASTATTYFVPTVTEPTQAPVNTANVITIATGSTALFTDSVKVLSNYTLDDMALPTGSTIDFINDKTTAVLTLPTTFKVSANADYKLGISANVKIESGASAAASTTTGGAFVSQIGLVDNVAPVLNSAKIVEATTGQFKTITLTFSEALATLGSTDLTSDFIVTINGSKVPVYSVTLNTDTKTINLVVGDNTITYASSQATVITVAPISTTNTVQDITDVQGNLLTLGTSVTATK